MSAPRYSLRIILIKHQDTSTGDLSTTKSTMDVSLGTRDILDEWNCLRTYFQMLRRLVITDES